MSDFRRLSDRVFASPQLSPKDVAEASAQGIALIVNNRPDGEEPGQPEGDLIAAAAREHGIAYRAIPVSSAGFGEPQVEAMAEALASTEGKVLGYCRSGTRSTFLWALAEVRAGRDPDDIADAARQAGYDVSPIRMALDTLSARVAD